MTVLFFLTTIILFLGVDIVLRRKRKSSPASQAQKQTVPYKLRAPLGVFFAPSHTWLSLFPSGSARLGIDDVILRMMEKPDVIFLKKPGSGTMKGEAILQLKEGTKTLTVRSPIEGDIVEVNEDIRKHPELMKEMLFSEGWAYTIKPRKISELKQMQLGENTRAWVQQEFGRLRDFIAGTSPTGAALPVLLQDGGVQVEGALKLLSDRQCEEFERQFLAVH